MIKFPREDDFWNFMEEREKIRLRRKDGLPPPWTLDPIFKEYSFTNVKRIHDRTTSLIFRDIYSRFLRPLPLKIALLNAALFRFHGTYASAQAIGWHGSWNSSTKERLIELNSKRLQYERVFTSAYIIPSCGDSRPKHEVVADIIDGIWEKGDYITSTASWQVMCDRLKTCWGVGSFMAKEIILDYMLITEWIPNDWQTWTPVGPGARRGAGIVKYNVIKGIPEWEALDVIKKLYETCSYFLDTNTYLDLTDIQFQLCEFAKYEKARTGVGRPKRKFNPTIDEITKGANNAR